MERKNQISEAGQQYFDSMDEFQRYHTYPREAFIKGATWSDEHPNSKNVYTKQQLIDMGFAFTTNGDIVTPDQSNEDLKKYLKYQKQKFIDKTISYFTPILKTYCSEECVKELIDGFVNSLEE